MQRIRAGPQERRRLTTALNSSMSKGLMRTSTRTSSVALARPAYPETRITRPSNAAVSSAGETIRSDPADR